jgi:two-component system response regulator HydG
VSRVLVVDDDAGLRYTLTEILGGAGHTVTTADSGAQALARLPEGFDLVLTDLRMPKMDGITLLRRVLAEAPGTRVIVLTAHGSERHAVDAMKAGAWDYLKKPFDLDELLAVVSRATEVSRLTLENQRLTGELALARALVFASPAMARLAALVARVAPRDVTVLITGESGTGKERIADAIVSGSRRAMRPYVRFNCASVPRDLAEAELFGHTRGAFTGAVRDRPGLFREAHGGTLLLDEIAELDPVVQAKLLRVLQTGELRPLGDDRTVTVDVRLLAATHRDLAGAVSAGTFREDLYWRLHVVQLAIPPLRERPEDIAVLARHFLARAAARFGVDGLRIPDDLDARLVGRPWPGNVRELEHAIDSLVALSVDGELDFSLLDGAPSDPVVGGLKAKVDAYERGLVVDALRATAGNRTEAARLLGVSRVTLHDKVNKHGLRAKPDE